MNTHLDCDMWKNELCKAQYSFCPSRHELGHEHLGTGSAPRRDFLAPQLLATRVELGENTRTIYGSKVQGFCRHHYHDHTHTSGALM